METRIVLDIKKDAKEKDKLEDYIIRALKDYYLFDSIESIHIEKKDE